MPHGGRPAEEKNFIVQQFASNNSVDKLSIAMRVRAEISEASTQKYFPTDNRASEPPTAPSLKCPFGVMATFFIR